MAAGGEHLGSDRDGRSSGAAVVERAAIAVGRLRGWKRALLAGSAGAVSALAMAPFHAWPVLLITFPVLMWLIDGCIVDRCGRSVVTSPTSWRRLGAAASVGWCFGFGYFLAGLYWVGAAFLVEADRFAWLLPLAVTSMPAGLALFFGLGGALAAILWRPGPARIVALALGFSVAEWLRGHVLTGFPWNTIGYALTSGEAMMQWSSVVGVYGLTLIAMLVFASPAAIWGAAPAIAKGPTGRLALPILMLAVLAGGLAWGHLRLSQASSPAVEGVRLRIVQPNIAQSEKWKPENRIQIFQQYLELSRNGSSGGSAGLAGISHLIWPESAVPFLLADESEALAEVARLLPPGTTLITGAARAEADLRADGTVRRRRIYNSLFVMDERARILTSYDKVRLVPFGEYLPLQGVLESIGLEQLTRVRGGFATGAKPRLLAPPGAPPFAPLICYEIIFPGAVLAPGTAPRWLLNVTNDAWFGSSTGPYQHLHQARVRAVEEGLPLVRAANTGISAVIDPYGRIAAEIPLNGKGAIDSALPGAPVVTPYARYGRGIELGLLIAAGVLWTLLAWPRRARFD